VWNEIASDYGGCGRLRRSAWFQRGSGGSRRNAKCSTSLYDADANPASSLLSALPGLAPRMYSALGMGRLALPPLHAPPRLLTQTQVIKIDR
jgi:hypothetical protein